MRRVLCGDKTLTIKISRTHKCAAVLGVNGQWVMEALTEDMHEEVFGLMKLNMQSLYEARNGPWDEERIRNNFIGHEGIVLRRNGLLSGFSFYEIKQNGIYIHTLQISPEFQNRTMGGQFFKWYKKLAESINADTISCRVFENNPAFNLYKKIGFHKVSEVKGLVELALPLTRRGR